MELVQAFVPLGTGLDSQGTPPNVHEIGLGYVELQEATKEAGALQVATSFAPGKPEGGKTVAEAVAAAAGTMVSDHTTQARAKLAANRHIDGRDYGVDESHVDRAPKPQNAFDLWRSVSLDSDVIRSSIVKQ